MNIKIIPTSEEKILEYYNSDAISQGNLKYFQDLENIVKYAEEISKGNKIEEDSLYYTEKKSMIFGQAVDTLVTLGETAFNNNFLVSDITFPGDKILSICHIVYDTIKLNNMEIFSELGMYPDILEKAILKENYYGNRKMDTNIKNVIAEGGEYFNQLVQSANKQIITTEEAKRVYACSESIKATLEEHILNKFTLPDYPIYIFTQVPLYWQNRKGLLDFLICYPVQILKDSSNINGFIVGYAMQILDLKATGAFPSLFTQFIKQRRLDIQLSWYNQILINLNGEENNRFLLNLPEENFNIHFVQIMNPALITVNMNYPSLTNIYNFNDSLLEFGTYGLQNDFSVVSFCQEDMSTNKVIPLKSFLGFTELLDRYSYFQSLIEQNLSFEEIIQSFNRYLGSVRGISNKIFHKI